MIHPNYYVDKFCGQKVYRCCVCQYDTFSEHNARGHALSHPYPILWAIDSNPILEDCSVVLAYTTWNNANCSTKCMNALKKEAALLTSMGADVDIFWVDNGSTDGTQQTTEILLQRHLPTNMGQSYARNLAIDYALSINADYLLMLDGDIEIIPYSAQALIRASYLSGHACVGMYSRNCTPGDDISDRCYNLHELLNTDGTIAWTQYGVFDCEIFRAGLRFDTNPVFMGEGWGFEDDDLGLQMKNAGYTIANTKYFRYGHYSLHSSLRRMDPSLAAKVHIDRRDYLYNKWKDNPKTAVRATQLRNCTMPVLDLQ